MKLHYYPDTDTLYISFNEKIALDGEEIASDVVVDYDEAGRITGIELEHASDWVDLTTLEARSLPAATNGPTA
jgi:uncharacterized protein YuzE